jgi:hypothetical protein
MAPEDGLTAYLFRLYRFCTGGTPEKGVVNSYSRPFPGVPTTGRTV